MSRPTQIQFLSRFAFAYEPTVRLMGFPLLWDAVAEAVAPRPGELGLDVCTGTGGAARELARRGASVVGIDLAHGMLRCGAKKHRPNARPPAVFVRMDARRLAVPDRSFPIVTCVMGLHEMAPDEREIVLGEIVRVASDRVVIAEYRVPVEPVKRVLMRAARFFEYLESDDFEAFLRFDLSGFLAGSGLAVDPPFDLGPYRVWRCRVLN